MGHLPSRCKKGIHQVDARRAEAYFSFITNVLVIGSLNPAVPRF